MGELTANQIRALRWIGEFPTTRAAWTVDGAPIRKQHSDKWNMMKIEGSEGSILISKDDLKAIGPYVMHLPSPDKLYALNEDGLALVGGSRHD